MNAQGRHLAVLVIRREACSIALHTFLGQQSIAYLQLHLCIATPVCANLAWSRSKSLRPNVRNIRKIMEIYAKEVQIMLIYV